MKHTVKTFIVITSLALISSSKPQSIDVPLDKLLAAALTSASTAKLIMLDAQYAQLGELKAQGQFDHKLNAKISSMNSNLEPKTIGSPAETQIQTFETKYTKAFSSGTYLGADLTLNKNRFEFDPSPLSPAQTQNFYDTTAGVSVKQQLWQNGFGSAARSRVAAAEAATLATRNRAESALIGFATQIIQAYHTAWLLQQQINSGRERIARQEKLLKLSGIKKRLGTLEESDYLQLQANLLNVKDQVIDMEKQLGVLWRNLVLSANMDDSYLNYDPMLAKLDINHDAASTQQKCLVTDPEYSKLSSIQSISKSIEAQNLNMQAIHSQSKPDLYLEGRLAANGVDPKISEANQETTKTNHKMHSIALGIEIPLGGYENKANIAESAKLKAQLEIEKSRAIDDLRLKWRTACRDFTRAQKQLESLKQSEQYLTKRLRLDDRRFEIGKTDISAMIRSEDDAAMNDLQRSRAHSEIGLISWQVKDLTGELSEIIQTTSSQTSGKP
jgi:outer membrane protein TolC